MRKRGISLMEIMLAVMVSGILAAATMNVSKASRGEIFLAETRAKLNHLRIGISMYEYRLSAYPTAAVLASNSYSYTDNGVPKTDTFYVGDFPIEPFKTSGAVSAALTGTGGWYYVQATGTIRVNLLDAEYGPNGTRRRLSEVASAW